MAETNAEGMVGELLRLLQEPDIDQSVRRGDIYSILIEYHY